MTALAAATAAFILTHLVSGTALRARLVNALGEWPYRGLYSALAFLMWGIILWAAAHIVARGDLKSLILFGGFLVVAAVTSHVPFVAIAQGRNQLVGREIGWKAPLAGLIALAIVFVLHPWLFGARSY